MKFVIVIDVAINKFLIYNEENEKRKMRNMKNEKGYCLLCFVFIFMKWKKIFFMEKFRCNLIYVFHVNKIVVRLIFFILGCISKFLEIFAPWVMCFKSIIRWQRENRVCPRRADFKVTDYSDRKYFQSTWYNFCIIKP